MSYDYGKDEVCAWIRKNFDTHSTILDVGACDGKWSMLLPDYSKMDAVEVFTPNYRELGRKRLYRNLHKADIRNFAYGWYDLIIFGDVLEHMSVEDAQRVLKFAYPKCRDMIIAVPFLYKQDAIYGNPYEVHIQDDLTTENFEERYPGYSVLCQPTDDYCYYHKKED